jgi:hypothetical protein
MDMLNLRSQDEEFRPHVDGAKSMDTSNFTLTPLPGSMRATLTIKGPGTILMQAQAEDFYQKDRDFYGMWDTRKDFAASRHEQWQAAPGDVVLLRSNDWDVDQGLLPSIHTPPPRTNIGNAEERIAGIFSRNSYIYQTPPEFAWK